jgi:hypothetical protein
MSGDRVTRFGMWRISGGGHDDPPRGSLVEWAAIRRW